MVLIQAGEKLVAGGFKFRKRFVVVPVQHGFLEELPKSLDQVEIGRIRWQKNQFDFGMFQIVRHELRPVITGIVANDLNPASFGVLGLDLLKQLDRRLGIDGVVVADDGTEIIAVDDAIDIEPLPARVAANLVRLTALDPAVGGDRIVVRDGWHP